MKFGSISKRLNPVIQAKTTFHSCERFLLENYGFQMKYQFWNRQQWKQKGIVKTDCCKIHRLAKAQSLMKRLKCGGSTGTC